MLRSPLSQAIQPVLRPPFGKKRPFKLWSASIDPPSIYVPDDAPPANLEAANYLADIIETASGKTRPSVIQQPAEDSVPAWAFKVGYPYQSDEYEESLIRFERGSPIELTGVDEFDPLNPDLVGQETETDYMVRAGTYHAVMTFAQEHLGVLNAWPGAKGEVVPQLAELTVFPVANKHCPSCKVRNFLNFSIAGNKSGYGISKTWLKRQRNFYCTYTNSGHPFKDAFDNEHPNGTPGGTNSDLFALQPNGTRSGWPFGRLAKLEVGAPALVDYWKTEIVDPLITANPHARTISCGFNDGHSSGHSVDPRALAMDYTGPDATPWPLAYQGGTGPQYALSDREVRFANRCAQRLVDDSLDYSVVMIAYGPTRPAPKEAIPAANVIVVNVANDFNNPAFESHRQNFDDWQGVFPAQIWRPNIGSGHGHQRGMWLTHVHEVGARFKQIAPRGCQGFTPDAFWEHWSTQWPMYYVMSQLLWDHTKDVDALLDDAYSKLFGAAADHIKAYYEATEAVIVANRIHNASFDQMLSMWDTAKLTELQGHLDLAIAAVTPGTDEHFRVEWVQAGMDWSRAVMDCIAYSKLAALPYNVTDPANLATDSIGLDEDSTAGWGWLYSSNGSWIVQSDVTNGSNFAVLATANNSVYGRQHVLPGTPDDLYLISVDVKRLAGSNWLMRVAGIDVAVISSTEWHTIKTTAKGGDVVLFRDLPPRDGSIYIDNFIVQAAEPIDQAAITAEWQAAVDTANAVRTDAKWADCPPIGLSASVSGRIPTPDSPDEPPPDDPDLV